MDERDEWIGARRPLSGVAVAGLVTALLGCTPIGLALTIAGHVQVRRGDRRGRGVVVAGYVATVLMTAVLVTLAVIGLADLRATTDDHVGAWRSTTEVEPLTLQLRSEAWGISIGGSFTTRDGSLDCYGNVIERSRDGGAIRIDLRGICAGSGPTYDRELTLRLHDDGTLRSDDGLTFHRMGG